MALVFQPKESRLCIQCSTPLEGFLATHVCPHCESPQPLSEHETYFSALNASACFGFVPRDLEKTFYLVSRALHPDRYTHATLEFKIRSNTRMSFLNQAYSILKDPSQRRQYLLQQAGLFAENVPPGQQEKPLLLSAMAPLIEAWFEIQDLLTENPTQAQSQLQAFESQIAQSRGTLLKQIQTDEDRYDQLLPELTHEILNEIASQVRSLNYLDSLHRDVERIKSHAHSN